MVNEAQNFDSCVAAPQSERNNEAATRPGLAGICRTDPPDLRRRGNFDFREAIVFEGEYRTLIATLATHERREDLLPGLRREDDLDSMFLAFTLASIDAATEEKELDGNWADAIAKRSVETYAVPANFRLLSQLANEFGQMIEQAGGAAQPHKWSYLANQRPV